MYFGGSSRAQYKSISFFGEVDPPPRPAPTNSYLFELRTLLLVSELTGLFWQGL